MKVSNLFILFFLISLIISAGVPCPIKLQRDQDGSIQFNANTGVQFKLEPQKGQNGWAKIRHISTLGDNPWSWIPMDKEGKLKSYARLGSNNRLPVAELNYTPDSSEIGQVNMLIKNQPFNPNDKSWIVAEYKDGNLSCKSTTMDSDPSEDINLTTANNPNFNFVEVYSPDAIYAGLGLL